VAWVWEKHEQARTAGSHPMRLRVESSPFTEESASATAPTQGHAATNS